MVIPGDSRSKWARVELGVLQWGSVLGLILHILYTADIPPLIAKHDTTGHLYADDIQAFDMVHQLINLHWFPLLMLLPVIYTSGWHPTNCVLILVINRVLPFAKIYSLIRIIGVECARMLG